MRFRTRFVYPILWLLCSVPVVRAVDFYFTPDTLYGNVGDTVVVHGRINASELLRAFTVYMTYDTNVLDLRSAPVAGALVAGRSGLDFRYLDHVTAAPQLLEIGATVFSTDYWAGPGEIFRATFVFRQCGAVVVPADPGFRNAAGTYVAGTCLRPLQPFICDHAPQSPVGLVIRCDGPDSISLHWCPVSQDIAGRALAAVPSYAIYRQQDLLNSTGIQLVATVPDTSFMTLLPVDGSCFFFVTARTP